MFRGSTSTPQQLGMQRRQVPTRIQKTQKVKNIFIETSHINKNIYLGESIDYSIKLYRRISIWSSISIDQEDMQGVWQNPLIFNILSLIVRKNGQRYYELELIKIIIY